MSKLSKAIIFIVSSFLIVSSFVLGLELFKSPTACPANYTQQQITEAGCDNGLIMGIPWQGWAWVLFYVFVIELAITFIIRSKGR